MDGASKFGGVAAMSLLRDWFRGSNGVEDEAEVGRRREGMVWWVVLGGGVDRYGRKGEVRLRVALRAGDFARGW